MGPLQNSYGEDKYGSSPKLWVLSKIHMERTHCPPQNFDFCLCLNWCSKLESILNNFGYNEEIFDDNLIIDIPTAKLKAAEINKERFDIEIESKPKLRTYKLFKSDFSTEEYILKHRSKYERSILCQFRIGILPLNIETGRYKNIKDNISGKMRNLRPDERICDLCDLNIVEDELHFLCVCPVYNDERQNLYRKIDDT